MIEFEKIRWQNLLSTGNDFTEVILNKSKNTLIVGENGAGKSTLLDALFFVLFGKPYRKINKPQLINSINKKNLLVELQCKVNGKQYLIRRGIKPNIFEIYCDSQLIKQPSSVDEYQDILEKTIFRFKMKSFSQYSILGSANYIPFMKLTAAHRREVIEDVLDLEIFSKMNLLLKTRVDENLKDIYDIEHKIDACDAKIDVYRKMMELKRKNNEEILSKKIAQQKEFKDKLADVSSRRLKLEKDLGVIEGHEQKILTAEKQLAKLLEADRAYNTKVKQLIEEMENINNGTICASCKQEINEEHKLDQISKRKAKLKEIESAFIPIAIKIEAIRTQIQEDTVLCRDSNDVRKQLNVVHIEESTLKNSLAIIETEINDLKSPVSSTADEEQEIINELHTTLGQSKQKLQMLLNHKQVLDESKKLLKDDGIKTAIIQEYIPIINQLINKYLHALDFFVSFELDENFNEIIKSRYRDEFSYESFSEGEKMRINLAILFAWRDISKKRNSSPTNLLIMDEVFDSSLDQTGTEEMIRIIENLTEDSNTFIISHKGDVLYDHFRSVIKFEKNNNFSNMVVRA